MKTPIEKLLSHVRKLYSLGITSVILLLFCLPAKSALAQGSLDCTRSPFGNLLMVGAEREIFVGYRGGSLPNQYGLGYVRLDHDAGGQLQLQNSWIGSSAEPTLNPIGDSAGTAVDLNGDGFYEFVQVVRDANSAYRVVSNSNNGGFSTQVHGVAGTNLNHQWHAVAAGNLTRTEMKDEEMVVVSRSNADVLNVLIVNGRTDGTLLDLTNPFAIWRSDLPERMYPELMAATTADLDGDGYNDEIIVAMRENTGTHIQLIALEYTPGFEQGVSTNYQYNLRELGSLRIEANNVLNLQVASGDLEQDFKDEIIVAYDQASPDNDGSSIAAQVRTYRFAIKDNVPVWEQRGAWSNVDVTFYDLALSAADTDGDGLAEIVLALPVYGSSQNPSAGLAVFSLDAEVAQIVAHNYWYSNEMGRALVQSLDLDAADLNRDGFAEIVAAFRDTDNLLQVVQLTDVITPTQNVTFAQVLTGPMGISLASAWRNGDDGRSLATAIQVSIADWDNDSLKAQYAPALGGSLKCKRVVEPRLTSAIFVPPFWQNIQGGQYIYSSVGRSVSKEKTNETAMTTSYGHSASGYFGGGVSIEGAVYSFAATVKLTAGYEYAASQTRGWSQSTEQTISTGWTNFFDFMVMDQAVANCYSYQLVKNNVPLDGAVRFCEHKEATNRSLSLDAWDLNQETPYHWTPIARDWSNLALFRGSSASQSSTLEGYQARLAADGMLDSTLANGSVAHTQSEAQPWWQIDLGTEQPISKVRIWNRDNVDCAIASCMNLLTDFYLFVSTEDFATLPNDPVALANHPAVHSYFHSGVAGRVITFRALDDALQPIQGRYVRIQLAGNGPLALAEVQVFGPNHVEPNRYPTAVWDPDATTDTAGNYVPGTDGWFFVQLYNPLAGQYETVRTRGNLLWNGVNQNVLKNERIGDGDSTLSWSLSQSKGGSSTIAKSVSHTASVGAEFDVEAGIKPVKVQMGGSYAYSTGLEKEEATTLAWSESFELDGGVQGFPLQVEGVTVRWPEQCRYGFQPYYYELTEESDYGYTQKLLVLDYIVPQHALEREANLLPCLEGISKAGANKPPLAQADFITTTLGAMVVIDALVNDSDPDGDPLLISGVGAAQHGAAAVINNQIHYFPNGEYRGFDSLSYTVEDGFGGTATAVVTVYVGLPAAQNQPPVAQADAATTAQGAAVVIDVLANDSDPDGDPLTISAVGAAQHGMAAVVNNQIRYQANGDYQGQDSFSYTISDGFGGTATAVVTVQIHPTGGEPGGGDEQPQIVADQSEVVAGSGPVLLDVLSNDRPGNCQSFTITAITQPSNGVVELRGDQLLYTPNAGFIGVDTFTYTVGSPHCSFSETSTVTVTVKAENENGPVKPAQRLYLPVVQR
jgi:hypothetical protein